MLTLSPLSKDETRKLMGYYADSGVYAQGVEETVAEKWSLSSGNPKELLAVCLRIKY